MNFLPKLSNAENKIIRMVFIISCIGGILLVSGSWVIHKAALSKPTSYKTTKSTTHTTSLPLQVDINAHLQIADHFVVTGTSGRAIPHLERVLSWNKNDLTTRTKLAHAYLEAGFYENALEQYDHLLTETVPESLSAPLCAERGIALFYLNRAQESNDALLECTKKYTNSSEALCFLGQIAVTRSPQSADALHFFEQAIALDSSYTEAWYQLARYAMLQSQYTKARELLLQAIVTNTFHSKSHARLGMVYYYLNYPELAKKSYQTALALNPDDFNTHFNLAELLYVTLGDTAYALKEYTCALDQNAQFYDAAFKIGRICMYNRMYKEAILYFDQALQYDPSNIRFLMQRAISYEELGQKEGALENYGTILALDPLNSIARQKSKLLTAP